MISVISCVIALWRARLYLRLRSSIIASAFPVAESIAVRRAATFPPFCDIVTLLLTSSDEKKLFRCAKELRESLLSLASGEFADLPLTVFGPFEAQIYKINEKCRLRMVLKCRNSARLRELLRRLLLKFGSERAVTLSVDVGPLSV